ncbi:MAG: hypothetical protein IJP31_06320 [Lachnospiraceae bacterium]|nr:hypothetical protein [Lachnospiraceae bacterium]
MKDKLQNILKKCKTPENTKVLFPLLALLVILASVWGPQLLGEFRDKDVLDKIHVQEVEDGGEGYRYRLNANEKVYILSRCLSRQTLEGNEQSTGAGELDYQELEGTYAFVVNRKGPSGKEITDEQIYETCNREIDALKELGILPEQVRRVEKSSYDVVLYSAIDVLEPRNNVAVWKVSLSSSQTNANKENRLIDAYIDADTGKIYEFYARTPLSWEEIQAEEIMEKWRTYLGLNGMEEYATDNPLLETTPYFKKYVFPGMGDDRTVVTVGFYDGINELFLKISR